MRSIYCLGAVRALTDLGLAERIRSVHASSAGCVSGAVLVEQVATEDAPPVSKAVDALLERLTGKRFIDQHRYKRVVDVDYLVGVIREIMPLSVSALRRADVGFEIALTDAATASPYYLQLADLESDADLYQALRATMAIPVLYHRSVPIAGRRFVDGGIADPLPLLRALDRQPEAVIVISSVARGDLARLVVGRDAKIVQFVPGLSPVLRRLMLTRNPLAQVTDNIMDSGGFCGVPVVRVTPSRPELLGSRVDTDRAHLVQLEELGYADGMLALAPLTTGPSATAPT